MRRPSERRLREELVWRGFGEISRQCFRAPGSRTRAHCGSPRDAGGPLSKVVVFDAALAGDDAPQRLVALGWDLEDLGMRYRRFVQALRTRAGGAETLNGASRARACFIVRTLLIHEYRRLHLRDPLLPAAAAAARLAGSAGGAALPGDLCASVRRLRDASVAGGCAARRAVAAPDASVLQRFGGIGLSRAALRPIPGHCSSVATTELERHSPGRHRVRDDRWSA